MARDYRESALEGANPVELIVALYDGLIRFLHRAADYAELGRVHDQRVAVRRTLDILMYLQAHLRMDVGGHSAAVLSEFYASVFADTIRASRDGSREQFEQTIASVRNVRDAWRQVADSPEANAMPISMQAASERAAMSAASARPQAAAAYAASAEEHGWTA
jgi:flagellar protein FliS